MSGRRNLVFAKDEHYHIFNRSNGNIQIFSKKKDLGRFLDLINFYIYDQDLRYSYFKRLSKEAKELYLLDLHKKQQTIKILSYAIMPNHFHFLINENSEKGLQTFISNIQNSFAKYYNIRNKRFGSLFQRPFKAKHIESDEQLLHLSRYIHLNPVTAFILEFENLRTSKLTSLPYYLNKQNSVIDTTLITSLSGSIESYEKFLQDQVGYQRQLANIKHLILD